MARVSFILLVALSAAVTAKICEKPVPNLDWISQGVDISQVDLHPPNGGTPKGLLHRAVEYTCRKGKKVTINGETYDQPDQIDRVDRTAQGSFSSSAASTRTLNKFKDALGVEVGVGATFPKGSFSVSTTYNQALEKMTESKKILTLTHAAQTVWTVSHFPGKLLAKYHSPSFATDLNALPANYESNPSPYLKLVQDYGTHYIHKGTFGGVYFFQFESSEKLGTLQNEKSIQVNAEASALNILKVKGAFTQSDKTVDEQFSNLTTETQRFYGGDVNLLEQDGFQKWWPTVKNNPSMQNCELKPITELVKNDSQRQELEKAVDAHLLKRFLENDLKKVLEHYVRGENDHDRINQHLNTIKALSAKSPIANLKELRAAANEIEKYALTPDWVFDVSQVCMKFVPGEYYGCKLLGKKCFRPNEPIVAYLHHLQYCVEGIQVEFEHARIPQGWGSFNIYVYGSGRDYFEYKYGTGSHYLWFRNIRLCFYGTSNDASQAQKNDPNDRSFEKCTKWSYDKQKLSFSDMLIKGAVLKTSF